MPKEKIFKFEPDWVSPPRDTVKDWLKEKRMSVVEFAALMEFSQEKAEAFLSDREPITPEIAKKLSEVLGSKVSFWINRESQYLAGCKRLGIKHGRNE